MKLTDTFFVHIILMLNKNQKQKKKINSIAIKSTFRDPGVNEDILILYLNFFYRTTHNSITIPATRDINMDL